MTLISIFDYLKNISDALTITIDKKSDLIPSTLFDKMKDVSIDLNWRVIPNWELFEYGEEEWGLNEFLFLVQHEYGDELQILTDCSYKHGEVVLFKDAEVSIFEEGYVEKYGEEFFQPLDYVVLNNNSNKVILVHHEGLLAII